jgi:hypothetical protein
MAYTSPFAKTFTDLQDYLAIEMPEIKWIDFNFDQINAPVRPSIKDVALLIDFIKTDYEVQQFSQYANMQIEFTLIFFRWNNTSSITPDATKEQALQFYETEQKFYTKMQGWKNAGMFNLPFNRVSSESVKAEDQGLRIRKMVYTAQYEDLSVGGA